MILRPLAWFYGVAIAVTGAITLITGHPEPLLGALIAGIIQLSLVAWFE